MKDLNASPERCRVVYKTTNYELFATMVGNRSTEPARVEKIRKSIKTNGWIPNPIIVNEKMEIIDGQGRFEALKSLSLPIEYLVVEGIGLKECIVFNNAQTNWTQADYIRSYADNGNENYKMLFSLLHDFNGIPQSTVIFVANRIGGCEKSTISFGNFKLTEDWYHESRRILTWLNSLSDLSKKIDGSRTSFLNALAFAFAVAGVDGEKLITQCKNNFSRISAVTDMNTALESVQAMYNFRAREPIYLVTEYDKYLRGKIAWYGKRWGDKKRQ